MFEGEKTYVFWISLIILGLASVVIFSIVWFNILSLLRASVIFLGLPFEYQVPYIVGAVIFFLIGLYMIKSGKKKPI
jgi:hypothetical protein